VEVARKAFHLSLLVDHSSLFVAATPTPWDVVGCEVGGGEAGGFAVSCIEKRFRIRKSKGVQNHCERGDSKNKQRLGLLTFLVGLGPRRRLNRRALFVMDSLLLASEYTVATKTKRTVAIINSWKRLILSMDDLRTKR
jgi:hypothetical protein